MLSLRSFMFERVYHDQDHTHVQATVQRIFDDLVGTRGFGLEEATDYLAGMTDRFALAYEVA
jgi:dGTP triphosphohydrolase